MPASLLPDPGVLDTLQTEIRASGGEHARWPQGFPLGRITQEYLVGRALGVLDVSGRVVAGGGEGGPSPAAPAAGPSGSTTGAQTLPVLVVDDTEAGELLLAVDSAARAAGLTRPVLTYNDSFAVEPAEHALPGRTADAGAGAGSPEDDEEREGPFRVVMAAPKAVAALEEYLLDLADVTTEIVLVGREKHMGPGLREALAKFFSRVDVTPGVGKSRILVGTGPVPAGERGYVQGFPRAGTLPSPAPGVPELPVRAHGACFGGIKKDPGTTALVRALAARTAEAPAGSVLDLGCGNGWLLACAGHLLPTAHLTGVDVSRAAVASARETLAAAFGEEVFATGTVGAEESATDDGGATADGTGRAAVQLSDAGEELPAEAYDLVLLNPPFHEGAALGLTTAHRMITNAYRVLEPGGRLVCVFNSLLRHRTAIEDAFGADRVEQWSRDTRFTVVSAVKAG